MATPAGVTTRRIGATGLLLFAALATTAFAEDEPAEPLDVGKTERVEVQFVLIDVLVLDRRDRTVPGLTVEDFDLVVDGRAVELSSVDARCSEEPVVDPRAGEVWSEKQRDPEAAPRKIVLAFDFPHLGNTEEVLGSVMETLERLQVGGEEHMVVSMGEVLRIETPFTSDRDALREVVQRMRTDRTLYAGVYPNTFTEHGFFRRVSALLDLMDRIPGRKIIVLYSSPLSDGRNASGSFYYDSAFEEIAAMAAQSRTAIYPVDSRGIVAEIAFRYGNLRGPPYLTRLANDTGGRMTYNTNDLGLAYARAQRDLSCLYTLGYYDRGPRLDNERRVGIFVRKTGIRVVHPESYVIRSEKSRRKSMVRTAMLAPQMFPSDGVAANLFLTRPHSLKRWDTVVAMELHPPVPEDSSADPWTLRGFVRKARGTVVRRFRREIPAATIAAAAAAAAPLVLVERATLRSGSYTISLVLAGPGSGDPVAMVRDVLVPDVPDDGPFVVGPFVGRAVDDPSTVTVAQKHEPPHDLPIELMINPSARRGEPLACMVRICRVGAGDLPQASRLMRRVTSGAGTTVATLRLPQHEHADDSGRVRCSEVVEQLPTELLEPGYYRLEIGAESLPDGQAPGFTVLPPRGSSRGEPNPASPARGSERSAIARR